MDELWKPVVGWEGFYEVSDLGAIKSLCLNRTLIRKQRFDKDGYKIVTLKVMPRSKTAKIHQEVLAAFFGPCPDDHQVNHKNGDRADNRLVNLEYLTIKENCHHAWANFRKRNSYSKLNKEAVTLIRLEYQQTKKPKAIAKKYGVSINTVWAIGTGRRWNDLD